MRTPKRILIWSTFCHSPEKQMQKKEKDKYEMNQTLSCSKDGANSLSNNDSEQNSAIIKCENELK